MKIFIFFVSTSGIFFCFPEISSALEGTKNIQYTTESVNDMIDKLTDDDDTPPVAEGSKNQLISKNPDDVEFYLYTDRYDTSVSKNIIMGNKTAILASGYNPLKPLIVIIHGFGENYTNEFPQSTKDEYMNTDIKSNIILVDWGKLSTPMGGSFNFMLYPFAARNVGIVGQRVSEFLKFLISAKVLPGPDKVHMVGYDLGAHIAGVTANRILLKDLKDSADDGPTVPAAIRPVRRITGLDPTGPLFYMIAKQENKLDSTDATFVDIIHTNQLMIGYIGTLGHADFFPNGGGPFQPGCNEMINSNGWCSHKKAYQYFIKSISDSTLKGCQCSSWIDSLCIRLCANSALFGQHCPPNARGKYFLELKTEEANEGNMEMQMKMLNAFAPKPNNE